MADTVLADVESDVHPENGEGSSRRPAASLDRTS